MRTSFSKLSLLALPLAALTACQDYEPFDEATVHATMVAREFSHNFEERYGKVDPNHNWGFGPIIGEAETRAGSNTNVEKNLWINKYHLEIPGWPDVYTDNSGSHNWYHYASSSTDQGWSESEPSWSQYLPAGDVTDEEIQYVSWYFRTQKVGREPIHCSDFWVQEISSDNDRDENGNPITKMPIYNNDGTSTGQYENVPKMGLNQLHAQNIEGVTSADASVENYDHINNFNQDASNNLASQDYAYVGNDPSKSYNNDGRDMVTTHNRMIQFYASAGTEDFIVTCNQETNKTWHNDWALVHLVFDGPSGRHYDGYYLGFDYSCVKVGETTTTKYPRDGKYSNWILKLTPAQPKQNNSYSRRIMCEDLGNTFDFDFNDVVFDATFNIQDYELTSYSEGDAVDVTITLRASGGTLPIYVGKDPTIGGRLTEDEKVELGRYEAHHLLCQSNTSTPVNVGPKGVSAPIATYHISLNSLDPGDIQIWVKNKGEYYNIGNPLKRGNLDNYNNGKKGDNVAPQKFAVPVGVRWMEECEFIETAYPEFPEWVKNANHLKNGKPWYDNANIKPGAKLYAGGGEGISSEVVTPDGGNGGSNEPSGTATTVFKYYSGYQFAIELSKLSEIDSNKTYTITFYVKNAKFNDSVKIKRANFGDNISDENNNDKEASTIDKANLTITFSGISGSYLVNDTYQYLYICDGLNEVSDNTQVSYSVVVE